MRQIEKCISAILFLALTTAAAACNSGGEQRDKKKPVDKSLADYRLYLSTLDTTTAANAMLAVEKYKTLFNTGDTLRNDSGYCLFEEYYYRLCVGLNNNPVFDTILTSAVDSISLDSPDKRLPLLASPFAAIRKNGFMLEETDDETIVIVPDQKAIVAHFRPFISAALRKYKEMVIREDYTSLSPTDIAYKAVWWNQFVNNYPSFIFADDAQELQQYYFTLLMEGPETDPVIDPDTKEADTSYIRAYQYVLREFPQTRTAHLLGPYYEALMDLNSRKADTILTQYKMQDILLW